MRAIHTAPSGAVNPIPNPHTARDALSVTDGATTVGYLVSRDGSHFSFDQDGILIGEFATRRLAMRSIPPAIIPKKKTR